MGAQRFSKHASKRPVARAVLWLGVVGMAGLAAAVVGRSGRLPPADFSFNNGTEVTSLDPATLTGLPGGRVVRALFEGLVVQHPETLEPLPGSAESWEISSDGTRYTFHMRANAMWSNGEPVTADDFVQSFRRLLDPRTAAGYASLLWYVKGARTFTSEVDETGTPRNDFSTVGIRAPDPRTLVVDLEFATPFFLDLLANTALCPVHTGSLEEARQRWPESWETEWMRPENMVTNGPFRILLRRINDRMRLVKWDGYWDADNVAMRSIDVLAVEQGSTALNMYLTGAVDFIERINVHLARDMMAREDFVPEPYLGTYLYRVNTTRPPFDDQRVRRALHLTIPRAAICENVLGMGQVPARALVPPFLPKYNGPGSRVAGEGEPQHRTEDDTEEARALLAAAGFGPGGAPLPPLEIHYNTADVHASIAQVVAAAWRHELGIDVKLRNEEWKVFLDSQRSLRFDVSRSSWICDYADPSSYLDIFKSGGENNRTGWGDPDYDRLLARAAREPDERRRMELLAEAEAILTRELPVLPIYYYVHQNAVAPRLGGFHHNVLDAHFPKFLYWMDDEELAARRALDESGRTRVAPHGPAAGLYSPAENRRRAEATH